MKMTMKGNRLEVEIDGFIYGFDGEYIARFKEQVEASEEGALQMAPLWCSCKVPVGKAVKPAPAKPVVVAPPPAPPVAPPLKLEPEPEAEMGEPVEDEEPEPEKKAPKPSAKSAKKSGKKKK